MTLQDLFVEYSTTSISELITIHANLIDWYTEMLYDDPWDTVAQSNKDFYTKVLDKLVAIQEYLNMLGADWDIDGTAFAKLIEI